MFVRDVCPSAITEQLLKESGEFDIYLLGIYLYNLATLSLPICELSFLYFLEGSANCRCSMNVFQRINKIRCYNSVTQG